MKIGILGLGNMGSAILKGLNHQYAAHDIWAINHDNQRIRQLQKTLKFNFQTQLTPAVSRQLDYIIVTLPAKVVLNYLTAVKSLLNPQTTILSAAAGIKINEIKTILPQNPIVTFVPNTPVAINQGTLPTCFKDVNAHFTTEITKLLSTLGNVIPNPEAQLDILGTVCGCGPAFVDVFMDALGDAAVENGVDRTTAYQAIASMVAGSGQLAFKSDQTPSQLKDAVTSPGGTTIKGVNALAENKFSYALIDAIQKAK